MADAYAALLDAPIEAVTGRVFNVGSDNHTVLELAAIVQSIIDVPLDLMPARANEQSYRITSTAITDAIGWRPTLIFSVANVIRPAH